MVVRIDTSMPVAFESRQGPVLAKEHEAELLEGVLVLRLSWVPILHDGPAGWSTSEATVSREGVDPQLPAQD
jgi:hypothetical protein